ncbi:hypothetical protein HUU62_13660 [Rhodoferax sp. 4810]|uniref:LTXXQ motif family protein n=1 Tax=Thiospirillum jenense TaxID=1653858 RepID=A0A839HD46_9GAMM|nr:hypothetical protein [Thiospirillum jenense]MBB1075454.1 hypothetical protein [Rhodoferax jenense]MBB1126833.1 hypothetical protein [Thiospirillum jenense]
MTQLRKTALAVAFATLGVAAAPLAFAADATPAAPAPAAATTTQAAPPASPADAARAQMEQRHAEARAERDRRYEELRKYAAGLGFEMPDLPASPERMQRMTPEERMAMREKRWQEARARAAAQGIDMPETPPWKAAAERRQAMKEQFDKYRATLDQLTAEQKEAVEAVFGPLPGKNGFPRHGFPRNWDDVPCPNHAPMGGNWQGPPRDMMPPMGMPYYPAMPQPPAPPAAPTTN